jgi:hypothetical protein
MLPACSIRVVPREIVPVFDDRGVFSFHHLGRSGVPQLDIPGDESRGAGKPLNVITFLRLSVKYPIEEWILFQRVIVHYFNERRIIN